jgi:RND superfamily putative drug exporter
MAAEGDGARSRRSETRFFRLGAFAYRRRWAIVAAWVVLLALAMPFLAKLTDRLSQGGFEVPGSQSDRVRHALEQDFGRTEINSSLVLTSQRFGPTAPQFRSAFARARSALLRAPGVQRVSDPYAPQAHAIAKDPPTVVATISLAGTQDDALKHTQELDAAVHRAVRGSGVRALLTGSAPFYKEFTDTTVEDLGRAEKIAFPVSLVILVFVFGSLVAAGMPLAMALASLLITFGVISAIAAITEVSLFTQNVASMIGIGVGIDYSLFVLTRFREELRHGYDVEASVSRAMASSGKAVFVSALTVVVALSGTQLVTIQAFKSMGWGTMIAVGLAGAAALTLLPALISIAGRRVNALRVRRGDTGTSKLWHRWGTAVMRRPWIALAAATAVLVVLALPALHLRLGSSGPSILPADSEPRVASEIVARAFGAGETAPVQVVVSDPRGITRAPVAAFVCRFSREVQRDPEVVPGGVRSFATLIPGQSQEQCTTFAGASLAQSPVRGFLARKGTETLISIVTRDGAQSQPSDDFVKRIRARLDAELPAAGPTHAFVGGDPGLNLDLNQEVQRKLVPVVGLVLVLSFLILMVFFRSLLLPLKAVLVNLLSVLAVYGALVFIFQEGHLEGALAFESNGHIESFLPLFLFSILFGLSMDYEVFLLARIREEYLHTGDNTEAVGWGLERTAWIITSAAVIMVTVFGAFAFARLVPIKSMGFGLALAVFIDASLVRLVLVPAAMRLMGRWNWWLPRWLDRRLPNVSLEGTPSEAAMERPPVGAAR